MEKMKYKISSRATILLGRESVSKVESALIELIIIKMKMIALKKIINIMKINVIIMIMTYDDA